MNKSVIGFVVFSVILFACNSGSSEKENISPETYSTYLLKGKDISALAQGVLLANVGKAMQQGGPEHAVEFCNLKASSIVDSLNRTNNCVISRISDKNRNPQNVLKNEDDKNLWAYFSAQPADMARDTLVQNSDGLVFYTPIRIALPTCLKCHGTPGEEIDNATHEKLQNLYPADLATGYNLNDFRGLWKIQFANAE